MFINFTKTVVFLAATAALVGIGSAAPSVDVAADVAPLADTADLAPITDMQLKLPPPPEPLDAAVPNVTQFICKPPLYRGGSYTPFMEGIRYLKSRYTDTPPTFEPHTNNGRCTRVSCSYGAGIYVCNDNDCAVQVPILTIANYAEAIARQEGCDFFQGPGQASGFRTHLVWGQAFDRNRWNVIVGLWNADSDC